MSSTQPHLQSSLFSTSSSFGFVLYLWFTVTFYWESVTKQYYHHEGARQVLHNDYFSLEHPCISKEKKSPLLMKPNTDEMRLPPAHLVYFSGSSCNVGLTPSVSTSHGGRVFFDPLNSSEAHSWHWMLLLKVDWAQSIYCDNEQLLDFLYYQDFWIWRRKNYINIVQVPMMKNYILEGILRNMSL